MKSKEYQQQGVAMTCRSYAEYVAMFALDERELSRHRILDVAGGASSFAAEARARGMSITSSDPMYAHGPDQLAQEGLAEIERSSEKLQGLQDVFDWSYYGSPEQHREGRVQNLKKFIEDYRLNFGTGAYIPAVLPLLPLPDASFDLIVCSHFLFLYESQFDIEFHERALREMLRLLASGGEVRVYPVVNFKYERYSQLDALFTELTGEPGITYSLERSGLPFIPNSTHSLVLHKA